MVKLLFLVMLGMGGGEETNKNKKINIRRRFTGRRVTVRGGGRGRARDATENSGTTDGADRCTRRDTRTSESRMIVR